MASRLRSLHASSPPCSHPWLGSPAMSAARARALQISGRQSSCPAASSYFPSPHLEENPLGPECIQGIKNFGEGVRQVQSSHPWGATDHGASASPAQAWRPRVPMVTAVASVRPDVGWGGEWERTTLHPLPGATAASRAGKQRALITALQSSAQRPAHPFQRRQRGTLQPATWPPGKEAASALEADVDPPGSLLQERSQHGAQHRQAGRSERRGIVPPSQSLRRSIPAPPLLFIPSSPVHLSPLPAPSFSPSPPHPSLPPPPLLHPLPSHPAPPSPPLSTPPSPPLPPSPSPLHSRPCSSRPVTLHISVGFHSSSSASPLTT